MRDFQHQTPQRDQSFANRRPKSTPDLNRNLRKVTKKSLNPAFKAVSEDDPAVIESPKKFSEVSDDNPFAELDENFILNPADTPSSETVAVSDLTSPSVSSFSVITNATDTNCRTPDSDSLNKIESIEAELVIKHLKEARVQVLKSNDVGPSKKLLDTLIDIIIKEFYDGLYEENEWLDKVLANKANLVFLSFIMGLFVMLIFWFFNSAAKGFHTGPTPT